jgi:xylan 1,4-beta-xylosidase
MKNPQASLPICILAAALFLPAHVLAQTEPPNQPQAPINIHVHANEPVGPYTPIWNYFGADEPNYLYAPNGAKLLGELAAISPAPIYIRVHNLLTSGNGEGSLKWGSTNVYTERPDGSPVYDFTITDRIFDALISAHVRPLVEIGFMPEALSTHPEPYRHTFPKGDIFTGWSYPPKDEAKWSRLIVAYATHLHERYGSQTSAWLWEVWNEPDIAYWHGTPAEYNRLYDLTAAAIRQVMPQARIGGPEATGINPGRSEAFLRQFLDHCAHGTNAATGATGAPLDFIGYHPKGSTRFVDGHVQISVGTQLRAVERGMAVVASYPEWKHTPIILGESDPEGCGACLAPEKGYRNGPLYGTSVTEATIRTDELARKYGVTIEGAVTWAFEFEDQPAFAGFRAIATNGIDKPVLNAFRLLGMLRGNWLATDSSGALPLDSILNGSVTGSPDINAVATRDGHELNVLLWNYHDADLPAPPAQVHLTVDGLRGHHAQATEFRMDADHSNAFAAWQKMGSPAHPGAAQTKQLQQVGVLEQTEPAHPLPAHNGNTTIDLSLPRQAVVLLRITDR